MGVIVRNSIVTACALALLAPSGQAFAATGPNMNEPAVHAYVYRLPARNDGDDRRISDKCRERWYGSRADESVRIYARGIPNAGFH